MCVLDSFLGNEGVIDVCNDDLAFHERVFLFLTEDSKIGLFEPRVEYDINTFFCINQGKLGIATGNTKWLLNTDRQQRRFSSSFYRLMNEIREVINHFLGQAELAKDVKRIVLTVEFLFFHIVGELRF